MSVFPCSLCRRRVPGKLASAYWAWFDADGGRSAWKLRYCAECAREALVELLIRLQKTESEDAYSCVSCGANADGEDSDPVYLTLYLPGKDPAEYALLLDAPCAATLRSQITTSGERLPDRSGVVRGPSHTTSSWDQLGLAPD